MQLLLSAIYEAIQNLNIPTGICLESSRNCASAKWLEMAGNSSQIPGGFPEDSRHIPGNY